MADATPCRTPGAVYSTAISASGLAVTVSFGRDIPLGEAEAVLLEADVHNVLELVLARYYVSQDPVRPGDVDPAPVARLAARPDGSRRS